MSDKLVSGVIVYHKSMGRGVIEGELKDGKLPVRMGNGNLNYFPPEVLVTEEDYQKNNRNETSIVDLDPYWSLND